MTNRFKTALVAVLMGLSMLGTMGTAHAAPPTGCVENADSMPNGPYAAVDGVFVFSGGGYRVNFTCDGVYVGNNDRCGDFRIVRIDPQPAYYGFFVKSCWTPVRVAVASTGGPVRAGDGFIIQQRESSCYPPSPCGRAYIHLWH